jgi:hypothetical protein
MSPADYDEVMADPQQVADRIYGSKIVIGLEQCMLFSTWGVKTCMIILYWKMTKNLRMNLFVKILAGYVLLGFAVIEITYYGVYCRPFSQYWAMPVQNMQCATYAHYSITQAVFNISSDAAMLGIPIPLLIRAQIGVRKKVLLMCVMSLGIFVIIAAILNKYFNFAAPLTTTYQMWYIREASTAMYVANLMCWWPLLRKMFGWRAFQYDSSRRYAYQKNSRRFANLPGGTAQSSRPRSGVPGKLGFIRSYHNSKLSNMSTSRMGGTRNLTTTTSEEAINMSDPTAGHDVPLQIWHKVEYDIEEADKGSGTKTDSPRDQNLERSLEEGTKYHAQVVSATNPAVRASVDSERRPPSSSGSSKHRHGQPDTY